MKDFNLSLLLTAGFLVPGFLSPFVNPFYGFVSVLLFFPGLILPSLGIDVLHFSPLTSWCSVSRGREKKRRGGEVGRGYV